MILLAILAAQPAIPQAVRIFCHNEPTVCPLSRRALADGTVTAAEMAGIERALHKIDCLPENRDGGPCGRRVRLCRAEIMAAREGLIGTAPTNEEALAGIGEDNPTPMCRRVR